MNTLLEDAPELVSGYAFDLPPELIAQAPPPERAGARLLTLDRVTGALADRAFQDLPGLLAPGDLLVLNDSRVIPARIYGRRGGRRAQARTQPGQDPARIEVLLAEETGEGVWTALLRPGRKALVGERLLFPYAGEALLEAEVIAQGARGERTLKFAPHPDFFGALDAIGETPLPPYIERPEGAGVEDRARYQTVYARERGSVAAPTAGLHFTPAVLDALRTKGIEIAYVTLHVGLGTFQPVRVERVDEIRLHTERYTLPAATAEAVNRARAEGRRVIAAGTTTVRTLEQCAAAGRLEPHSASTSIFLAPGSRFRVVDGLLTNFHLPESTLLMLVCAFAGYEPVMRAYRHAVRERYRFFSYGDCMLIAAEPRR